MEQAISGLAWLRRLTSSERRVWGLLTLWTIVSRLPLLTYPKACDDEQVYAVVAIEMLHGGRPYIDAVERKPPLLFYVYDTVLRFAGEHNYFALHLVCLLWVLATMACLYVIARRWVSSTRTPGSIVARNSFHWWSYWSFLQSELRIMVNSTFTISCS